MGVCELGKKNNSNFLKIDGKIKDLSKDYLCEYSIKEPIRNKYKILNKIGKGSFGNVFIGVDDSGKKYAIKSIEKKYVLEGQLLINEIRMGIKVNHPNILSIKEIYEDMNEISIVMDYLNDGDLFSLITKSAEGKLDDIKTINIISQILEGLNYLHNEAKICHRDLKPENCLISIIGKNNNISVKIIDFGVAHYIKKSQIMREKVGSFKYMAPEIILKPIYNEKVDLWSVGIILYNMTTGREPFALKINDFKKKHIMNTKINFDIIKNKYLRELCQELLERNPNKRIDAKTAVIKARNIKKKIIDSHN